MGNCRFSTENQVWKLLGRSTFMTKLIIYDAKFKKKWLGHKVMMVPLLRFVWHKRHQPCTSNETLALLDSFNKTLFIQSSLNGVRRWQWKLSIAQILASRFTCFCGFPCYGFQYLHWLPKSPKFDQSQTSCGLSCFLLPLQTSQNRLFQLWYSPCQVWDVWDKPIA